MLVFALIPAVLDPSTWVRVDDPDHPDAIARSATGAILASPPTDGTPWRRESLAVPTGVDAPGAVGDAVAITNADLWHADGITGAGVRVAVFDVGWFGDTDIDRVIGPYTSHDCFATPSCERAFDPLLPATAAEGGLHGWGCAEVIRQIAPDAELHLVRTNTFTLLENAVDWAIREHVDVVSMSLSFYNDSFYDGTGPHDRLIRALDAAGVLMVTSAGNDAALHWQGPYVDADADGRLDGDGDNAVMLYLERATTIYVAWNQYGARCGDTDLEVRVVDADGNEVGVSREVQDPASSNGCEPVDIVNPVIREPDWYRVEIVHRRGVRVGVDVNVIARSGTFFTPMPEGSLTDPAVHPLAIAVGAVRTTRYWDGPPEGFSSRGPTRTGLAKPEIMGPDGLSTLSSGPVGFFGTSASTPAVAGLVALVMQDEPSLSSREAFGRLRGWAHLPSPTPALPPGAFGAGMARLPVRDPSRSACGPRGGSLLLLILPWCRKQRARVVVSRPPRRTRCS